MTDFDALYIEEELRGIDYGTKNVLDAAAASYAALFAKEIAPDLDAKMLALEIQKSEANRGPEPSIVGPHFGKVGFKVPWRGGKTSAAAEGTSPVATLAAHCGLERVPLPGGADKVTGGTTSTLIALDADLVGYKTGHFILVNAAEGVTDDLQLRPIIMVESDETHTTLTVSPAFTTAPVALDTFYPVDVLIPEHGLVSLFACLNVYLGEGTTNRHKFECLGCAGSSFKLEQVKSGELPWAAFEFEVNKWSESRLNRVNAEDGYAEAMKFVSDKHYLDAEIVDIESLTFDVGTQLIELPGQNPATNGVADQGRLGWLHKQLKPVVSFNPYYDDQYFEDWIAGTERALFAQGILDSKQAWGLAIRKVQFTKAAPGSISEGMVGASLTSKITDPGQDEAGTPVNHPLFALCFSGQGS